MNREPPLPAYVLRYSQDAVTAITFIDDKSLVSGTACGKIEVWNLKSHHVSQRLDAAHDGTVLWLSNIPSSSLVSQGRDGKSLVWNWNAETLEPSGHQFACGSLTFCRGTYCQYQNVPFIALPSDTAFKVFDLNSLTEVCNSEDSGLGMCMALKLAAEPSCLIALAGYEDGTVSVWDCVKECRLSFARLHNEPVMCLAYDAKNLRGFSGSADDVLAVWTRKGGDLEKVKDIKLTNPGLNAIAVRDDGRILATAGWDARVRIFSTKSLRALAVLDFHREAVNCLDFSPQLTLASGSKDKLICLWNIYKDE